jgi:hypothetical protein
MIFQVSHQCAKNGIGEIKDDSENNATLRKLLNTVTSVALAFRCSAIEQFVVNAE